MPRTPSPQAPTAERLLAAGLACFARKWYGSVSVAEVCRAAGLSNGVFYRYFDGKEALFQALLERVLERVREAVEGSGGDGPRARLRSLAEVIFRFSEAHPDLVSVFREGQYRHYDFERRLAALYTRALAAALGREVSHAEYLFAFGALRFCAIRRAFEGAPLDLDGVCDLLERGLFRGQAFDPAKVFGGAAAPLPVPLAEGARERLLRAGRRLFGEQGYSATNIHEIAAAAGLSVGAFYTYFPAKEAFHAEVVAAVGHDARAFIAGSLRSHGGGPLNGLEHELRGLWLWLVHLSLDRHCYPIVREAEFVLPAAARAYYEAFAAGYRRRPPALRVTAAAPGLDEATAVACLMGIAHYLGLEAAFDGSPLNARALVEAVGLLLARGFPDAPFKEEHP